MLPFFIERYEHLESSNTFAKQRINETCEKLDYHVILCRSQSKGRGTRDHIWISKEGNIFMSILIPLDLRLDLLPGQLSITTGVGLAHMSHYFCPHQDISIKWPNDVLINKKKVAGILIEIEKSYAIVGIGMNLVSAPSEIMCSTFLEQYTDRPIGYQNALQKLLEYLSRSYEMLKSKGFKAIRQQWYQLSENPKEIKFLERKNNL